MSSQLDDAITYDTCTKCGTLVAGIHNRWACPSCGECSPYSEPPQGWQADPGYDSPPTI